MLRDEEFEFDGAGRELPVEVEARWALLRAGKAGATSSSSSLSSRSVSEPSSSEACGDIVCRVGTSSSDACPSVLAGCVFAVDDAGATAPPLQSQLARYEVMVVMVREKEVV